jgi:glycosyltransferase involved in cell wall biosynthesis/SAM-dependent methyltransferase
MKRILFVSRSNSEDRSAYTHRLDRLRLGMERLGYATDILHLGNAARTSHTMIPLYIPELSRVFRRFDVIHAGGTPCAFVACLCRPFHRKTVVYDVHGDVLGEVMQEKQEGRNRRKLGPFPVVKAFVQETVAMLFSDRFLVVSKPLGRLFHGRGVHASQIHLVRNGVDLERFSAGSCVRSSDNRRIFTYAGKFQPYQAVSDFVEAACRLSDRRISARFRIIGFSEEDADLRSEIEAKAGKRIELMDAMPQEALIRQLADSDVLVIPRRDSRVTRIAFPTKFAEYIALGKPVLVSSVDESAEFVRKHDCGVVYGEGAAALERTMIRLCGTPERELEKQGRNGRALAESVFDWDTICESYRNDLENGTGALKRTASLVDCYRRALDLDPAFPLTEAMVWKHWRIETRLARAIRDADPEARFPVIRNAYHSFFKELPWLNDPSALQPQPPVSVREEPVIAVVGRKPCRILEIGCGKGDLIRHLAGTGHDCIGIDIDSARYSDGTGRDRNLQFLQADGIALELPRLYGTLDTVISVNVIEHFHPDDIGRHFLNVRRLLKPGGRYLFKTPHGLYGPHGIEKVFGVVETRGLHLKEYSFLEMRREAIKAGFKKIEAVGQIPKPLKDRMKNSTLQGPVVSALFFQYLCFLEYMVGRIKNATVRRHLCGLLRYVLFPRQVFMVVRR